MMNNSATETIEKKKRKTISLETKIKILDLIAAGEGTTSVGKRFGLHEATIRTIRKNEDSIRKSVLSGTKVSAKVSSYTRDIAKMKMEKTLAMWIEDNWQKRVPLDENIVKQMALRIYMQIQEMEPSTSSQSNRNCEFSASSGWFTGFLKRHDIYNAKVKGEISSIDETAAVEFSSNLVKIIEEGGYTADQVWNADEVILSWKKMPSRTCLGDYKETSAPCRVSLVLCSNASGDRILKPLLINRPLKAECTPANFDSTDMPVHWMTIAKKHGWAIKEILLKWFHKCFVPDVKSYLEEKNLNFKVLLVIGNVVDDNINNLQHSNVRISYLPPKLSYLIQPLDQGIIPTFKTYYVKQTFKHILNKLDEDVVLTLFDVWNTYSLSNCIANVGAALSELKPSALNACWQALWPGCVTSKQPIPSNKTEYPNIIMLAYAIGGKGFDDLSFTDIDELVVDTALIDEEIMELFIYIPDENDTNYNDYQSINEAPFTADLIEEGLQLASKLEDHFLVHDPIVQRAEQFKSDLRSCLSRYKKLHYLRSLETSDRLMLRPKHDCKNDSIQNKKIRLLSENDNK